ncbi:hypothetical protein CB1_000349003 [Camelus ferus]|nr:hypothetical protein CB1_000349003 [Camelus ferus]
MRGNCRSGLLAACFRELKPSLCLTPDACALPSIARLPFKPIISRRMRVCFAQENGGEVGASGSGATGGQTKSSKKTEDLLEMVKKLQKEGSLEPQIEDLINRINELQQAKKKSSEELGEAQALWEALHRELDSSLTRPVSPKGEKLDRGGPQRVMGAGLPMSESTRMANGLVSRHAYTVTGAEQEQRRERLFSLLTAKTPSGFLVDAETSDSKKHVDFST